MVPLPTAVSRRRLTRVLHQLLDDEHDLYLATRNLEAAAVEGYATVEAQQLARQAWHLDQMMGALVSQLGRADLGRGPTLAEALVVSDLSLVFGELPLLPVDDGLRRAVCHQHGRLRHRLSVFAAVFSGARRLRLAALFRRLAMHHAFLQRDGLVVRPKRPVWRS